MSETQVLIAEDDFISRKLLEANLTQMGYGVSVAQDGEDAWRQFDAQPTRIVVSDWLMPGMDGLELCRKIRARENTDYTYFIMLTANVGEDENYFKAMDSGVDDFLTKPLDRNQLQIRLRVAERILLSTSRIQSLETMLTICAYTKRINFPDEGWQTIEDFLLNHFGIQLSHGVDPDYYETHIKPELARLTAKHESGQA
ncbi:response regulator [Ruficoccus sp. ZRK36]|uniref:response regulator n=1 Tax=Ruficoccus sp. ZRK36 TaxID=2866311 RepID=UPI001C738396|nr:response regulator [Ruficoccus sp. ZRK36]QYY35639.1 response regulator [Ruficoccus sp. ZRK36]